MAGAVLAPVAAHAASTDVPDLPDISDSALEESVSDIDLGVSDLDTRVSDLELTVDDYRDTSSGGSGGDTITLNSDILFGFDEAKLSPEAKKAVGDVVAGTPTPRAATPTTRSSPPSGPRRSSRRPRPPDRT